MLKKHKFILDIDSAGDDILALLYAALHPHGELLGVTTVTGACGSVEQATNVALNIVALTQLEIPVFKGMAQPLEPQPGDQNGDPVNFDEELRGKFGNRLDKFNEPAPTPTNSPQAQGAVDYLIQAFGEQPGEIDLITTGPLTNVAQALRQAPALAQHVRHAYVLGGCFSAPGNITPVTEYNIWADARAAKEVLTSGMSITLIPLDICEDNRFASGMLTRDHLADMDFYGQGAVVEYIRDKFPVYIDIWREYFQLAGFPMDDVITVAAALDESLCTYSPPVFVDVELEGRLSRGQTIPFFGRQVNAYPEREQRNVQIAQTVDGKRFIDDFIRTIIGKNTGT